MTNKAKKINQNKKNKFNLYKGGAQKLIEYYNTLGELNNHPLDKSPEEIGELNFEFTKSMMDIFLNKTKVSLDNLVENFQEAKERGGWNYDIEHWNTPNFTEETVDLCAQWFFFRRFRKSEKKLIENAFCLSQYANTNFAYLQIGPMCIESLLEKKSFEEVKRIIQYPIETIRDSMDKLDSNIVPSMGIGRLSVEMLNAEDYKTQIYGKLLKTSAKKFMKKILTNFYHLLNAYENGLDGKFEENRIFDEN